MEECALAIGDIIVGMDIGTSKVSLVIGEVNNFNQIEVLCTTSCRCNGIKKGKIVDENEIVTNQMPKTGVTLFEGADVFLYTENSNVATSVTVPNFKGKTLEQCINMAQEADLNIVAEGSGLVVSQDVLSNTQIEAGSVINLTLKSALEGGY